MSNETIIPLTIEDIHHFLYVTMAVCFLLALVVAGIGTYWENRK